MGLTVDEVADLTPSWFSQALGESVTAVEVLDAHSGTTGRARIRLRSDALPETVFVKLQPFTPEQRAFLRQVGLGVAEARLAVLHATYRGREIPWLATPEGMRRKPDDPKTAARRTHFIRLALDQFGQEMGPAFRRLAQLYIERSSDIVALFGEGELTLIHGDTHSGNLFVDDGRTGFYDWAVVGRGPGMRDVAYFLCNSLPTEVRRSEQDALVDRYRSALDVHGGALDERTAVDQYRLFSVYPWIAAVSTAAVGSQWQPIEIARAAMTLTTTAIEDLGAVALLEERL